MDELSSPLSLSVKRLGQILRDGAEGQVGENGFIDLETDVGRIRIVGVGTFPETQIKDEIEKTKASNPANPRN